MSNDLEARVKELEESLETLKANAPEDKLAMVVMSGDLDKLTRKWLGHPYEPLPAL